MNRTALMKLLVIVGLPGAIAVSLLNGVASPVGWGIGWIFVALYLVAGVLLFRVGPLWPRAGLWYVLSCLAWGSCVCLALVILPGVAWTSIVSKLGWEPVLASFAGGIPEELAKAFGVLLILYSFRELNRPWHGFVTGGLVGLGFEINENLMYGAVGALIDANSDLHGAVLTWLVRTIAGPGLHVMLAAMSGWGIGLALFCVAQRRALWWIGVAIGIHFCWNILSGNEVEQVIRLVILMVVLFSCFVYIYVKALTMQKSDKSYVLLM
ncbi:PrsW family intramembrane metalloprotease [Staphylococcus chromogenes]|nr:PrsW family intramembrane metalloprotease [Staphylococcus chromogenes]